MRAQTHPKAKRRAASPDPAAVRLVVFDLDDTLYLERDFVRSAYVAVGDLVRRRLGIRGFFDAAWSRFVSGRRERVIDRVLEEFGVKPRRPLIRELLSCYRFHPPSIRLTADALRFLRRPPGGITVGVITDGRPRTQRAKIRALGVDRWVEAIEYSGRWGPRYAKPHPRAFRSMQEKFGWPGSACLYVGDHPPKDFPGPMELGWSVCRLRRRAGLFKSMTSPGVAEVADCDELASLLTRAGVPTGQRR
jgi:putative hydrolase of the HAD superfamily